MVEIPFEEGDKVKVTSVLPDSQSGPFLGKVGTVASTDPYDSMLSVFVHFEEAHESYFWVNHKELTALDEVVGTESETLEQKRDRLKKELEETEAALHEAAKPVASELPVGTVVRYLDRANSNYPVLMIKQADNAWFTAWVTSSRMDGYMQTRAADTDRRIQTHLDTQYRNKQTLDIYTPSV